MPKLSYSPSQDQSRKAIPLRIIVDNLPVKPSKSAKCLGVTISANLIMTWSEHISQTCKSAKRTLGLIRRKLHLAPPNVHQKIYKSTVLPKLEYCSAVWDPHHAKDKDALESVQKLRAKSSRTNGKLTMPTSEPH